MVFTLSDISVPGRIESDPPLGMEVVFCVDISRSMLAQDIAPSRIEKVKTTLRTYLSGFPNILCGLTVFKGSGTGLVPLTEDPTMLIQVLDSLSPEIYTSKSTDLEQGIASALGLFSTNNGRNRYIVLCTDGETQKGNPEKAAELARRRDIPIMVLGAGTLQGTYLAEESSNGSTELVFTNLKNETLGQIAAISQGVYIDINNPHAIRDIIHYFEDASGSSGKNASHELYYIPLFFSFCFLLTNLIMRTRKWRIAG